MTAPSKFDLAAAMANGGKCRTVGGDPARVICADIVQGDGSKKALAVAIAHANGDESLSRYEMDGRYCPGYPDDYHMNLVNLPVKREGWINVYRGRSLDQYAYTTREQADAASVRSEPEEYPYPKPCRIACIYVEWEE